MMRAVRWTPSVLATLLFVPALAQTPPRFESDVDLVAVDAYVVDSDGKPVSGLAPSDFTVKIDGKARPVVSARFVETAPRPVSPAPRADARVDAPVPAPPPAPEVEGRRIVIVIDREELGGGAAQNAVSAASQFIAGMGPADRAALFSIPSGPRLDFTGDREALLAALAKVGPARHSPLGEFNIGLTEAINFVQWPSRSGLAERECADWAAWSPKDFEQCVRRVEGEARRQVDEHQNSVQQRLQALEAIAQALALAPGPKTLVLVSGGFTSVMSAGGPDVLGRMRDITNAAAAARITLYTIYLSQRFEGISPERTRINHSREQDVRLRAEGLEALTGMNGGHLFEVVASAGPAFTRLASETSGYYLLGIEPEKRDRDGKPHDIEVKALRKGVDVRARRRFVMTKDTTMARGRRGPFDPAGGPDPASPVRMATHVLRGGSAGQIRVIVGAEVKGLSAGRVALTVSDVKGAEVGNVAEEMTVSRGGAARYEDTLVLPRGPYVLKVEAVGADGKRVFREMPLNAELLHGVGFDASDLLLFEESPDGKRLSSAGTVRGAVLRPYLELYVQEGLPTEDLAVSLDVVDTAGKRRAAGILSVRDGGEPGLRFAEGRIDVGALPPGRYSAQAVILFGTKVARRIERRFDHAPTQSATR
jgi:VWFA-related protein